jgi:hypothetical protein
MQNIRDRLQDEIDKPVSETIVDRVHRHLRDIRRIITDDDLRNVRLMLDINNYYEDFLNEGGLTRTK